MEPGQTITKGQRPPGIPVQPALGRYNRGRRRQIHRKEVLKKVLETTSQVHGPLTSFRWWVVDVPPNPAWLHPHLSHWVLSQALSA